MARTLKLETLERPGPLAVEHCFRCKKPLKLGQPRRWIHCIGGTTILHPDDEAAYVPDAGDMGGFPLGLDCAKRIGLEWSA